MNVTVLYALSLFYTILLIALFSFSIYTYLRMSSNSKDILKLKEYVNELIRELDIIDKHRRKINETQDKEIKMFQNKQKKT